MPTLQQLIKKARIKKPVSSKSPALKRCPQKKGVCLKVYIRSPKKPNSAKRKVTDVQLSGKIGKALHSTRVIGYIPGEGHSLQQHSVVMIRGGRVKDLPGVRYHLIAGKFDFKNTKERKKKRSKYGVSRKKEK
jgi:small subunit ribosomal protein S12